MAGEADLHAAERADFQLLLRQWETVRDILTSADVDLASYARLGSSGARGLVGKGQLSMTDLGRFWPRPERGEGDADASPSPVAEDA